MFTPVPAGLRVTFELTKEQQAKLLDQMAPEPYLLGNGGVPLFSSQQDRANRAWDALGRELNFDGATVLPVPGKGSTWFSAVVIAPPAPPPATDEPAPAPRPDARAELEAAALALIRLFEAEGLCLEIERVPLKPLAMGHARHALRIWKARG